VQGVGDFSGEGLGRGENDTELKTHQFFKAMSWSDLAQRKIQAPRVKSELRVITFPSFIVKTE
jgi:hypothetical protein